MKRTVLHLFSRKDKAIRRGGRPHLDYLIMFKVLLLQRLHHLSDDAMDDQLLHRLSFRRFVGCHEDTVPDAKTIWLYRETLTKSGREKELFDLFYAHLTDEGLIANASFLSNALNKAIHVRTIRTSRKAKRWTVGTRLNGAKKMSMRLGHAKVMPAMLVIKTMFVPIENQK